MELAIALVPSELGLDREATADASHGRAAAAG